MSRLTKMLDTNVLLYDPKAFENFPDCNVIIPIVVFEELDEMKHLPNDLGRNARLVLRQFDRLKNYYSQEDLVQGVVLENGSVLSIFSRYHGEGNNQFSLDRAHRKNQIIYAAYLAAKKHKDLILVSKDFAIRIKAQMSGLKTEDYKNISITDEEIYSGIKKHKISKQELDLFLKNGVMNYSGNDMHTNEFCILSLDKENYVLARYEKKHKQLVSLKALPQDLWGIKPRNIQQRCALELILKDNIKLITLVGQAGTGKTLLALACGLRKVFDEAQYTKILVSRPIMPLGKDIGFLPGSKEEKLFHWMQPIYDNLEYLCHASSGSEDAEENLRWIKESQKIELEAVTYIRGRTLPKMFIIIDEAQNLTPHEIKTIISRAGEGTKVILAGDPSQIDNPYLDVDTNGLSYAIAKFRDHSIFGHMSFDITERSELSSLAAQVL